MKINDIAVPGLALAGVTIATFLGGTTTMASTLTPYKMETTQIIFNGDNIINPQHVIAKDPWSGGVSTWIPIKYLQQTLKQAGFLTKWDGTDLTFVKYPSNWKLDVALGNPEAVPIVAPKGQMQISLVDGGPPSMNLPKLVVKALSSGVYTTYAPIYYIDDVLTHDFEMQVTWNGATKEWNLLSPSKTLITMQRYASSVEASNQIANDGSSYLNFDTNTPNVSLGLGIIAKEGGGLDHAGLQWREGDWTVKVLWYGENQGGETIAKKMVTYLHTHMLPVPNSHGVIMINGTNPNSSAIMAINIIAWQEDDKVYKLEQSGDPIEALQTVVNSQK